MARLPDLEALAIFARVADLGSFAKAAGDLKLSKPTVSKAITRLESRLKVPLLHRTSRTLALTDNGKAVLERARRILEEGSAAEAEASAQSETPTGTVRLTAPMSFGLAEIAPLLPEFLETYPDVRVDLNLSDAHEDLIAKGYDLAVRIAALADSSLRARRISAVDTPIVAAPAYLDRVGRPKHPIDLELHQAILYSNLPTPSVWRLHHEQQGEWVVNVPARLQANNADAIMPALIAGLGLAIQPSFAVWRELNSGKLEEVLPGWRPRPISLYLVMPPGIFRPMAVSVMIDFLAERLARSSWTKIAE
ncbi:LysR family transcriptional regulator [Sphingomonas edaphi]|uniref:LysR family transcriptional regulator n=1 Tax=Sphingomonas edaphi TaxID=2315689 RepID=A0A418PY39_9SPHN|nr:LysR family transcriptional regulator [Sphingomonas edaphi]RIX27120.1 LysR family transcriptional regulator [Sphingomonas edaphi]